MQAVQPGNENKGLDQILEQSAQLMAKKGYHGTSMRDLAQTTGRSLSGLYHYFSNKDELLFLINYRGFTSLVDAAQRLINDKQTAEQRLKCLISNHVNYFYRHQSEMRVMMFSTQQVDEVRSKEIKVLKNKYTNDFTTAVSDYILQISGKKISKNLLERKSYLLFGMMNWVYGWFSTDEHGTVEELVEDIYSTFTEGCLVVTKSEKNKHDEEEQH